MGQCGCEAENKKHIFELDKDKYILLEEVCYCDFCGEKSNIRLSQLTKQNLKDCFMCDDELKIKKLGFWCNKELVINPLNLPNMSMQIDLMFDNCYDNVYSNIIDKKKGTKSIKDISEKEWDKFDKILNLLKKEFIKECKSNDWTFN